MVVWVKHRWFGNEHKAHLKCTALVKHVFHQPAIVGIHSIPRKPFFSETPKLSCLFTLKHEDVRHRLVRIMGISNTTFIVKPSKYEGNYTDIQKT